MHGEGGLTMHTQLTPNDTTSAAASCCWLCLSSSAAVVVYLLRGGHSYEPDSPPYQQSMQQQQQHNGRHQQQQQRGSSQPGSSAYPGVSTRGLQDIGYGEQAAVIDAETQQQNQYLDEISKGLDQLKFGAQVRERDR